MCPHQAFDSQVFSCLEVVIVSTIIGLGMLAITICDLGHRSLAVAAAQGSLCQQRCDSQPGCCVSGAAVPGLDKHKKRKES